MAPGMHCKTMKENNITLDIWEKYVFLILNALYYVVRLKYACINFYYTFTL